MIKFLLGFSLGIFIYQTVKKVILRKDLSVNIFYVKRIEGYKNKVDTVIVNAFTSEEEADEYANECNQRYSKNSMVDGKLLDKITAQHYIYFISCIKRTEDIAYEYSQGYHKGLK